MKKGGARTDADTARRAVICLLKLSPRWALKTPWWVSEGLKTLLFNQTLQIPLSSSYSIDGHRHRICRIALRDTTKCRSERFDVAISLYSQLGNHIDLRTAISDVKIECTPFSNSIINGDLDRGIIPSTTVRRNLVHDVPEIRTSVGEARACGKPQLGFYKSVIVFW